MDRLTLTAPAKINLGLDVLRKREDGYHDLRMIMQTIDLNDTIELTKTEAGITMECNRSELPVDGRNLAVKAAKLLLEEAGISQGVHIRLEKRIPMAAGLAGGSTDGAAVLLGVNEMFGLGLSREELMERGVKLGADVPYCILKGTALAEGIGEELTILPDAPEAAVVIAKPDVDVSTAFVYGNLRANELKEHPPIDAQIEAVKCGDLKAIARTMGNVLETVTVPAYPIIARIKESLMQDGALGAMMSGSGPTVFGLFETREQAQAAAENLADMKLETVCVTGFSRRN
ncbi:MAG: 4-(cytidine 5'-diphospho)-2-C-methyl-D-erythritol kinase [Lachnospiraceae bacterium]|nr:4-(cytidine 5'-diphospho)-2-C-methyl-D-erythritol kinase [Lachnospiraceae bacterium]